LLPPLVALYYLKEDGTTSVMSRDALALLDQMCQTVRVRALGAKLQAPAADLVPRIHTALAERRAAHIHYHPPAATRTPSARSSLPPDLLIDRSAWADSRRGW